MTQGQLRAELDRIISDNTIGFKVLAMLDLLKPKFKAGDVINGFKVIDIGVTCDDHIEPLYYLNITQVKQPHDVKMGERNLILYAATPN